MDVDELYGRLADNTGLHYLAKCNPNSEWPLKRPVTKSYLIIVEENDKCPALCFCSHYWYTIWSAGNCSVNSGPPHAVWTLWSHRVYNTFHQQSHSVMNPEILHLDKYFSHGSLWPQKERWGAIDIYPTKPLRALNTNHTSHNTRASTTFML